MSGSKSILGDVLSRIVQLVEVSRLGLTSRHISTVNAILVSERRTVTNPLLDARSSRGVDARSSRFAVAPRTSVDGEKSVNDADSTKCLAYTELVAPMTKAIQELQQQVQRLQAVVLSQYNARYNARSLCTHVPL